MARDTSRYVVDGVRRPSVTEILRLAGLTSLDSIPESYLERARQRGEDLHAWIEGINDGVLDEDLEPPQQIVGRVAAYRRFLAETGFRVLKSEQVVVNRALDYVGTYDLLGELPGLRGELLVDLKATTKLYPETRLQVCGYAMALDPRPARAALQLLPDGRYKLERYADRADESDWIAACRVAHFKLAHGLAYLED